jgi:hypothetical protein
MGRVTSARQGPCTLEWNVSRDDPSVEAQLKCGRLEANQVSRKPLCLALLPSRWLCLLLADRVVGGNT